MGMEGRGLGGLGAGSCVLCVCKGKQWRQRHVRLRGIPEYFQDVQVPLQKTPRDRQDWWVRGTGRQQLGTGLAWAMAQHSRIQERVIRGGRVSFSHSTAEWICHPYGPVAWAAPPRPQTGGQDSEDSHTGQEVPTQTSPACLEHCGEDSEATSRVAGKEEPADAGHR